MAKATWHGPVEGWPEMMGGVPRFEAAMTAALIKDPSQAGTWTAAMPPTHALTISVDWHVGGFDGCSKPRFV